MDIQQTIKNFEKKGYAVKYFETATEAVSYIADSIKGTTVGFGGSITLRDLGLFDRLSENNKVYWHWKENTNNIREMANGSEVYLLSANAISESGDIVNIDGSANRIAASVFKKNRLIYVVGINKIVPTLEDAIWRARNVAAPPNAKRLNKKTPCAVKGDKCYNCASPDRICRVMSITMSKPESIDTVEIVIVNEPLGY